LMVNLTISDLIGVGWSGLVIVKLFSFDTSSRQDIVNI
jgi:hypothetical protein